MSWLIICGAVHLFVLFIRSLIARCHYTLHVLLIELDAAHRAARLCVLPRARERLGHAREVTCAVHACHRALVVVVVVYDTRELGARATLITQIDERRQTNGTIIHCRCLAGFVHDTRRDGTPQQFDARLRALAVGAWFAH